MNVSYNVEKYQPTDGSLCVVASGIEDCKRAISLAFELFWYEHSGHAVDYTVVALYHERRIRIGRFYAPDTADIEAFLGID